MASKLRLLALLGGVVLLTVACLKAPFGTDGQGETPVSADAFRILSGSENQIIWEQVIEPWCREQDVECAFSRQGSLDIMLMLETGQVDYDVVWPASDIWRQRGDTQHLVSETFTPFRSEVVLAVRRSIAESLGWIGREVSWREFLDAVSSGGLSLWTTNASQSNSGFSFYMALMTNLAGNQAGEPLRLAQLEDPDLQAPVNEFLHAIDRSSPSTGFLMETCIENYTRCEAVILYDALVIEANQQALVPHGLEPLYVVSLAGDIAVSDHTMGFISHDDLASSDDDRSALRKLETYRALREHLLSDDVQARIRGLGRRATDIGVRIENPDLQVFNPEWGLDASRIVQPIAYPNNAVISRALELYFENRPPGFTVYCLDASGSMADQGWDDLVEATRVVFDAELAGYYYIPIGPEDTNVVLLFNAEVVTDPAAWTVVGNDPQTLAGLYQAVRAHRPGDGTDMYRCLSQAVAFIQQADLHGARPAIILMTDGKSEQDNRESFLEAIETGEVSIPIYSIMFGDADPSQLDELAERTLGENIDGRGGLDAFQDAFRRARGYN